MIVTEYLKRNTTADDLHYEKCQYQIYFGVLENVSFKKRTCRAQPCGWVPGHREGSYLRVPHDKTTLGFWKESQKLLPLMELELWGFSPHCSCSFCFPGLCRLRKSFSKRAGGWMSVSEGDCKLIHGAERVEFTGWVSYTPLTPSNDFSGSWDVPTISSSAGAAHLQRKALVKGRSGSQMSWKDKILIG